MASRDATFDKVAELAGFAMQVQEQFSKAQSVGENEQNFDRMVKYYMDQQTLKDDNTKRSIFEKMLDVRRQSIMQAGTQQSNHQRVRDELLDFAQIQRRQAKLQADWESIDKLAQLAPKRVQRVVEEARKSKSPYVETGALLKLLAEREYEKVLQPSSFINKDRLRDSILRNKQPFNEFMQKYQELPCDAFTLAITKQTIEATNVSGDTKDAAIVGVLDKETDSSPVHVLPARLKQDIL